MKISRKHMKTIDKLVRSKKLEIGAEDIDRFLGTTLYLKRVCKQNGYPTVPDLIKDLKTKKPGTRGGKYVDYI